MRGDIIPPKRQNMPTPQRSAQSPELTTQPDPVVPSTTPSPDAEPIAPIELPTPQPITPSATEPQKTPKALETRNPTKKSFARHKLLVVVAAICSLLVVVLLGALIWYTHQLSAIKPGSNEKIKVTIEPGTGPSAIASVLKKNNLIRDEAAFSWFVRLEGKAGLLQSGSYRLSQADDVPAIVKHLTSGNTDTFSVTFLPGATLAMHRKVLINAGYSAEEVDAAFNKTYDSALFEGKPAGSDLEGYIYGETYNFSANATLEDILKRTFQQFETVIAKEKLKEAYAQRGLSLYQGITLASVIQREVALPSDAAQVAQVFELRLKSDMPLGSDVTYQYIADKSGQARDVNIDSPYNTRRYKGLPPGPIASPGADSLKAVGYPATGDYVYFLSGDDDKTYFARTNDEHEANVRQHCQKKCQII